MTIAPIVRTVQTKAAPARAFDMFSTQIGSWWPKGRGVGARPSVTVVIEPRESGRWYELDADGVETQWGRVLTWSPPSKLVLAWQLDANMKYDPDFETEVEILFEADGTGGTLVTLTHSNLERFGQDNDKMISSIGHGWTEMVDLFSRKADQ